MNPRLTIEVTEPTNQTQYYQVVVKNDGGSPANHVNASMFFWDVPIEDINKAVTDENITIRRSNEYADFSSRRESRPEVFEATISRLAPNVLVSLYAIPAKSLDIAPDINSTKKYYISAADDKGVTSIKSNFRLADTQRGLSLLLLAN